MSEPPSLVAVIPSQHGVVQGDLSPPSLKVSEAVEIATFHQPCDGSSVVMRYAQVGSHRRSVRLSLPVEHLDERIDKDNRDLIVKKSKGYRLIDRSIPKSNPRPFRNGPKIWSCLTTQPTNPKPQIYQKHTKKPAATGCR